MFGFIVRLATIYYYMYLWFLILHLWFRILYITVWAFRFKLQFLLEIERRRLFYFASGLPVSIGSVFENVAFGIESLITKGSTVSTGNEDGRYACLSR